MGVGFEAKSVTRRARERAQPSGCAPLSARACARRFTAAPLPLRRPVGAGARLCPFETPEPCFKTPIAH
jgi:hypothetical protein